jgi:hypothetical protein
MGDFRGGFDSAQIFDYTRNRHESHPGAELFLELFKRSNVDP